MITRSLHNCIMLHHACPVYTYTHPPTHTHTTTHTPTHTHTHTRTPPDDKVAKLYVDPTEKLVFYLDSATGNIRAASYMKPTMGSVLVCSSLVGGSTVVTDTVDFQIDVATKLVALISRHCNTG